MRFEDVYGRWRQRRLSQAEAAEILGMSERSVRRWRDRYRAEGLEGLAERRLGKASARRVPVGQVHDVLTLDRARYRGFSAKPFHDKLRRHHGFTLGDTWTKLRRQAAGLVEGAAPLGAAQEAPAPAADRHAAAPGRLAPLLAAGARAAARPDRDHGRCHQRDRLGLFWWTRKAP